MLDSYNVSPERIDCHLCEFEMLFPEWNANNCYAQQNTKKSMGDRNPYPAAK
jgi:hypothetical protein